MTRDRGATASSVILLAGFVGALGEGLREVIGCDAELRAVVDDCADDLAAAIAEHEPDVVLVNCEGLSSAIELRRLVLAEPATGVVVAVPRPSRERDEALLSAGARVVVPITAHADELRAVLRLVARGLVGPPRPPHSAPTAGLALLTAREAQVLELLAARRSAAHIAEVLHVSVATVNSHRRHIYEKLGVHSRAELALYAAELVGAEELERAPLEAPARERLAYRRRIPEQRERDRAVVIDMCAALGARRWHGRGA